MNVLYRSLLCSYHFSKICLIVNIFSIVGLFWGNPIGHSFNFFSTMSDNLLFNNIADILYAILSSVIGLWLLHFNLSPFLYIGHTVPSLKCVGSCSLSHISKINLYSFCFKVFCLFVCQFWGYIISTSSFARF